MTLLTLGALRFLRDRGLDRDALARVVVAQREWAAPQSACAAARSDHRRRGPRRAARRVSVHTSDVLRDDRRRRRGGRDLGRARRVTCHARRCTCSAPARPPVRPWRARCPTSPRRTRSGAPVRPRSRPPAGTPADIDHAMLYDADRRHPVDGARRSRPRSAGRVGRVRGRRPHRDRWSAAGQHQRLAGSATRTAACTACTRSWSRSASCGARPRPRSTACARRLTHTIGGMFQAAATAILSTDPE